MDHDEQTGGLEEGTARSHESPGLQGLLEENNREEIRLRRTILLVAWEVYL